MKMRTVAVKTAADGSFSAESAYRGEVRAVIVEAGDLSTPDIAITDEPSGTAILSVAGVGSGSHRYYPQVATNDPTDGTTGDSFTSPVIVGKLKVAVTGGGDSKSGYVRIIGD